MRIGWQLIEADLLVLSRIVFLLNLYTSLKMNTANVVVVRAETPEFPNMHSGFQKLFLSDSRLLSGFSEVKKPCGRSDKMRGCRKNWGAVRFFRHGS